MKKILPALACSLALVSAASAAGPAACPPYTFVGRIVDAHRVAFDDSRVATLRAYDASNDLIAVETTFHREDSTRNYALMIPMASSAVPGCAVDGDTVSVTATDPAGRVWSAVIDPARIGTPGSVAEVDIVLADDADGDGIDDALFEELRAGWEDSDAFDPEADYNPAATDSDGDGASDLSEALVGTNPFKDSDCFAILSVSAGSTNAAISFPAAPGHAYVVGQSSTMTDPAWAPVAFVTNAAAPESEARTHLSISTAADYAVRTLYLFPTSSPAFFRVQVQ